MGGYSMHSYQCKNCKIVGIDSVCDTLTLNCLNGYSRARIVFEGVSHMSSTSELTGALIQRIETEKTGEGLTVFVLHFQDSANQFEIAAASKQYLEY